MGRVKLEIKKIENPTNRQVTYSKRRNGLVKKAYELSVLCDIDIAVIMFSPSGKLTQFSRNDRIEDVIARLVNTPPHERAKRRFENMEYVQKALRKLNDEREQEPHHPRMGYVDNTEVEELRAALKAALLEKQFYEQKAKLFQGEDSISSLSSTSQLMAIEMELEQALRKVKERRHQIENSDPQMSVSRQSMVLNTHGYGQQQLMDVSSGGNSGLSDANMNPPYHTWLDKRINDIEDRMTSEFMPNHSDSTGMLPGSRMREQSRDTTDTSTSYYHGGTMSHQLTVAARGNQMGLPGGENDASFFPGPKAEIARQFSYQAGVPGPMGMMNQLEMNPVTKWHI